jgi:predicted lipoprotein
MMRQARVAAVLALCGGLASCVPWTVRPIETETKAPATAAAYVDSIWSGKLVPAVMNAAVDARVLLDALAASPAEARTRYAGSCCFMVKGAGTVLSLDTRSRVGLALLDVAPFDGKPDLSIQIGPVLRGNSLRDATGIVRFTDFTNQLQFADAGNEINDRVLKAVLSPVAKDIAVDRTIHFVGTIEARDKTAPPLAELVPVQLTVEAPR